MTSKIIFLGMLALLVGLSMPAMAQDPGNVGGPGAATSMEGRGAVAPLPVPDSAPYGQDAPVDETPGDEIQALPLIEDGDAEESSDSADSSNNPDDLEPAAGPIFMDAEYRKPWWKFW